MPGVGFAAGPAAARGGARARQHPVDGGGADGQQARPDAGVEVDVAVTLQRREQNGEQRLEPLGANAIGGFPEHDQRLTNGLVVQSRTLRSGRRGRAGSRRRR